MRPACALLAICSLVLACGSSEPRPLPNVVLVFADDMGLELGAYGNAAIRTPNLDRLAREGVRFERAYAASPSCSSSRAALLTGRLPHATGVLSLIHGANLPGTDPARLRQLQRHSLKRSHPNIAQTLRRLGYSTAIVGKWHLSLEPPTRYGFGLRLREDQLAGFLVPGRPFFLYLCPSDTHRPFAPNARFPYAAAQVQVPPELKDTPLVREDLAAYYAAVSRQDERVGRVLELLDRAGVADDTIVIFASDSGPAYPRAKPTLYEWGVRTPLLLRYPRALPAGGTVDVPVSHVDVFPTLLELLGRPALPGLAGQSLVPAITGQDTNGREAVFSETHYHDYFNPARAVHTRRWKYIRNFAPDAPLFVPNGAQQLVGLLTQPLPQPPRPGEELYDLETDPLEGRNLAAEPGHAAELERMRGILERHMRESGDAWPILDECGPSTQHAC